MPGTGRLLLLELLLLLLLLLLVGQRLGDRGTDTETERQRQRGREAELSVRGIAMQVLSCGPLDLVSGENVKQKRCPGKR